MAVEPIYQHPEDYELEVASQRLGDEAFWSDLVRRERPKRVLEIGCGTGRLTIPLAREGVCSGFTVTGLDTEAAMLDRAREHLRDESADIQKAVRFVQGDARDLSSVGPSAERFDVILMPYGVAHHFLTYEDRLAAWQAAHGRLSPGGLFVVDITMPDLASLAESQESSPRALDLDACGDGRTPSATNGRAALRRCNPAPDDGVSVRGDGAGWVLVRLSLDLRDVCLSGAGTDTALPEHRIRGRAAESDRMVGEPYDNDSHQLIALARPATP